MQNNDIEMYSTHNEGKSVTSGSSIRTLKNKTYKYMTSDSKNVYIDKLDDLVNKYNNTCDSKDKMKPADVKSDTSIDSNKENSDKDPKFKIDYIAGISKYKNVFPKVTLQIGLK